MRVKYSSAAPFYQVLSHFLFVFHILELYQPLKNNRSKWFWWINQLLFLLSIYTPVWLHFALHRPKQSGMYRQYVCSEIWLPHFWTVWEHFDYHCTFRLHFCILLMYWRCVSGVLSPPWRLHFNSTIWLHNWMFLQLFVSWSTSWFLHHPPWIHTHWLTSDLKTLQFRREP